MYFDTKSYLKSTRNHTTKHAVRKESFKLEISWKMQNINSTSHWLDPFQWSHVSWKKW